MSWAGSSRAEAKHPGRAPLWIPEGGSRCVKEIDILVRF